MPLKLYYDLMSQPSRTLYIILKTVKCPFVSNQMDLRKGAHISDEYTKINRFQRVPVIDHDGFILTESVAIIKYLAGENIIPENLYPKENKARARVDEYLEWQHIGLRLHCSMFFRKKYLEPTIQGVKPNMTAVQMYEKRMESALHDFDTKWLGRGTNFITGNTATVADLLAACELEQPRMAGYDASEKYPNIGSWMKRVREEFNPHYEEAHIILNKVVKKYKSVYENTASKL